MPPDRYDTPPGEGGILRNKLGLTDSDAINEEEAAGFLRTEVEAIDALDGGTTFSLEYLYTLHRNALGHLYDFAGRLRTVNMSKDGFLSVPAHVLPQIMNEFDSTYLAPLDSQVWEAPAVLDHLAELHAELLYIHPFREGNGRIVRLFTKLIFLAKTGEELHFDVIAEGTTHAKYIAAVQQAASKDYTLMKELFRQARS